MEAGVAGAWISTTTRSAPRTGEPSRNPAIIEFSTLIRSLNLPDWAKSSQFTDVDAVTGASIDVGQHIYTWDLTDAEGKSVPSGKYALNVEVAWWPSMEYQTVSGVIQVGKAYDRFLVKDETLVPYLEVKYYPK